ncbi:MAG: SRPBCC family protein [Bacteroidota bacterium]
MKLIKNLIIFLIVLVIIVLVIAALVPSEFKVERDTTINKPTSVVFEYTKYLRNQENFSVWAKIDPNMKREYVGIDGTVGFISAWDSDHPDVGKGEQEITMIDKGKRIDYELRFLEPWESTSPAYLTFTSLDSVTTSVKWGFEGEMPYPSNLMLLFMDMDAELGKDLHQGLDNLKEILEKQ